MDVEKRPSPLSRGSKNLLLLGLASVLIASLTTFVALKLYHDSGDIYLDRSRPGFLPDDAEAEEEREETDYVFSDSGKLTEPVLDDFLENLKSELNRLNDYTSNPFGPNPLSDESLGI